VQDSVNFEVEPGEGSRDEGAGGAGGSESFAAVNLVELGAVGKGL